MKSERRDFIVDVIKWCPNWPDQGDIEAYLWFNNFREKKKCLIKTALLPCEEDFGCLKRPVRAHHLVFLPRPAVFMLINNIQNSDVISLEDAIQI